MAWKITCKPTHPRGQFRRDGRLFTVEPTILEALTPALEAERAIPTTPLVFEQVPGQQAQEELQEALLETSQAEDLAELDEDLDSMSTRDLRALADRIGLKVPAGTRKMVLIEILRRRLQPGVRH